MSPSSEGHQTCRRPNCTAFLLILLGLESSGPHKETKGTPLSLLLCCGSPHITACAPNPTKFSNFLCQGCGLHLAHFACPSNLGESSSSVVLWEEMPHPSLQKMRVPGPSILCSSTGRMPRGTLSLPRLQPSRALQECGEGAGHAGPGQPTLGSQCGALTLHFTKMPKSPPPTSQVVC